MTNKRDKRQNRRSFLQATAATTAAGTVVPYFAWTQKAFANESANDRPGVGCIGMGGMGKGDAKGHSKFGDILAVCDVDSKRAEAAKNDKKIGKGKADTYEDYRKILDRDDIDVVSIVTTDHWHVKIAVEALEAGKHVFCQKPLTLTLEENQLIRNACKKHADKTFMVGTQQRSDRRKFCRAVNMVQKGLIGDVKKVTCGINGSPTGGPFKVEEVPKELNWEMWLGQAPLVEYRKKRCHYEFRWWYEYSGGKFTDWGAHHVDIATWALGLQGEGMGPVEIDGTDAKHPCEFVDGMPTADDVYNTSHDFSVKCKYANGLELDVNSRVDNGILFEGSKGRIFVNRKKITGTPVEENWDEGKYTDADKNALYKGKPAEGHKDNFYRCIREGGLPISDVFSHVQAMSVCHLSAVAARLGRVVKWDPQAEKFVGDDQAQALFARERREGYDILNVEKTAVAG